MTTKDFQTIIQKEASKTDFERYLKQLVYKKISSDEKIAIFEVNNKYIASWIKSKFTGLIQHCFEIFDGSKPSIEIKLTGEKKSKKEILKEQVQNETAESTILNPSYTFDSFVVGPSNQMAYNASLAVSNKPGIQYNPLFIYGGTGLGKTHLLQAVGNYAIEKGNTVIYVTIEQFMNDFTFSLKNKSMDHFRNKYRKCDVLLIDDIQFLSGKEQTQEEFFHTFNELHEAKKQIVISSDKHPREIATLEERLRSRFEWGITADIQPPDYETKMAILKKRAELEHLDINQEVMQYVATNINSNIRELEGALNKIYVFANLEKKPVTLELAENALKDTIECQKEVTPQLIMDVVAEHYNISVSDIISKKKNKEIANPRQICMYLSRKYTDYSLQNIGKIMGNRDHTTVIHGHDKIGKMLETDENLKSNLDIIIKKLNPPT